MVTSLAKRAMTTTSQKACYVVDHLVGALGGDSSSSLRRAIILTDIDQYPGSTQAAIMERVGIHKSALNREIEWLFNYGCIMRHSSTEDGREVKLETCGYSKSALEGALDYFDGDHTALKGFLEGFAKILKLEKPTLRDAKIFAAVFEKGQSTKQQLMQTLYDGSVSTKNRAVAKLIEEGVITGDAF